MKAIQRKDLQKKWGTKTGGYLKRDLGFYV